MLFYFSVSSTGLFLCSCSLDNTLTNAPMPQFMTVSSTGHTGISSLDSAQLGLLLWFSLSINEFSLSIDRFSLSTLLLVLLCFFSYLIIWMASLHPWNLITTFKVNLDKMLVSLIVLSFDHQNHSKWPKWGHVRYRMHVIQIEQADCTSRGC